MALSESQNRGDPPFKSGRAHFHIRFIYNKTEYTKKGDFINELTSQRFLLGLFVILIIVSIAIILPYLAPILMSMILAYVFYPLYKKLKDKIHSKNISATIVSLLIIILIIVTAVTSIGTATEGSIPELWQKALKHSVQIKTGFLATSSSAQNFSRNRENLNPPMKSGLNIKKMIKKKLHLKL